MEFLKFSDGSIMVRGTKPLPEGATVVTPNTVEASREKHLPVAVVEAGQVQVTVGSVEHPMTAGHYIQLICLETSAGVKTEKLLPVEAPKAVFALAEGETPIAAYALCNLHGLWKTEL